MKNIKKITLIALFLVLIIFMTACVPGDARIMKAIKKQGEIESFQSDLNISFELSSEGFDEETKEEIEKLSEKLNGFVLNVKQVYNQNEKRDQVSGRLDISGKLGEDLQSSTIWIDGNLSKNQPSLVEIFKLPEEAKSMFFLEDMDSKEYIVCDFSEVLDIDRELENEDFKSILDWSLRAESTLENFMENFGKETDLDLRIVNSRGRKIVNGEKLNLYEINLNDEDFKEILRYTGNTILEDEDLKHLFEEYFEIINDISDIYQKDQEFEDVLVDEELEDLLADGERLEILSYDNKTVKEKFNGLMDKLNDIKIIGEEGVKIELGINKDGFIVSEKTVVNIVLDSTDYLKFIPEEMIDEGMEGKINFKIKSNVKMKDINNKNLKVDMPEVNEENSCNFMELIELQEESMNVSVDSNQENLIE